MWFPSRTNPFSLWRYASNRAKFCSFDGTPGINSVISSIVVATAGTAPKTSCKVGVAILTFKTAASRYYTT